MDDEYFLFYTYGEREEIERLREQLEASPVVFMQDFTLEAVDSIHSDSFMIPSGHMEMLRIHEFKAEERHNDWNRE
eukprot:CAMPEP_0197541492 /NCGR_PEP_ID=MMETSP1318-20131121/67188_1 /TAXON_ID=552666 /ORGANISM="Partenskyella glossopodia, Strain RCC365" /LENGTH=75 /DNA_ID=CAMNT_0043100669 /DNA_START=866 /DNA_END=1093 /DNA_ORIENTATION=+